jgi:tetratricopeptide (TPR) repeat protein
MVSAAAAVSIFLLRRRTPWLSAAALLFVLPILPVSGLLMFQYQYHSTTADHYLYVSMLGPALVLSMLLRKACSRGWIVVAGAGVVILGARSFVQARIWDDDLKLFTHSVQMNPRSVDGYNNLALAYLTRGDPGHAIEQFRRSIEISPDFYLAYQNLAHALSDQGDTDGAIAALEQGLATRVRLGSPMGQDAIRDHVLAGQMLAGQGKFQQAQSHFDQAIELESDPAAAERLRLSTQRTMQEARQETRQHIGSASTQSAKLNPPGVPSTTRAATRAADRP